MPNYCYCGRSEMQPFCDGSHNVVPARKQDAEEASPAPEPLPVAMPRPDKSPEAETPRPGLFRRLFGRG